MNDTKKTRTAVPEPDLSSVSLSLGNPDPERKRERNVTRAPKERSKVQKAFDTLVAQAHEKWVKAGCPKEMEKRPLGHVKTVKTEDGEKSVRTCIRKSGQFLNLSIRFAEDKAEGDKVDIAFSATTRPPKEQ